MIPPRIGTHIAAAPLGPPDQLLHRYFLAGDDMKCEAVEEEILATYRAKEEAIIAQKAKAQEVGRVGKMHRGEGRHRGGRQQRCKR